MWASGILGVRTLKWALSAMNSLSGSEFATRKVIQPMYFIICWVESFLCSAVCSEWTLEEWSGSAYQIAWIGSETGWYTNQALRIPVCKQGRTLSDDKEEVFIYGWLKPHSIYIYHLLDSCVRFSHVLSQLVWRWVPLEGSLEFFFFLAIVTLAVMTGAFCKQKKSGRRNSRSDKRENLLCARLKEDGKAALCSHSCGAFPSNPNNKGFVPLLNGCA